MQASHPIKGVSADLGLLLLASIWGVNFPVIKAALADTPPLAFNAFRFLMAAATLFVLLRFGGPITWPAYAVGSRKVLNRTGSGGMRARPQTSEPGPNSPRCKTSGNS